jgi:hypothetical protein
MDRLQVGRWLGPELVNQSLAELCVGGQRLRRLTCGRQSAQQQTLRSLPQRLARHQLAQLRDRGLLLAET